MSAQANGVEDIIGKINRCIIVVRDGLLTAVLFACIVIACYLWPDIQSLWPDIKQQIKSGGIESVTFPGAISIKLGENVAHFQSDALTIEAVEGPSELLDSASLQDLIKREIKGAGHFDQVYLSNGPEYNGKVLLDLLARLGPKFVIFNNGNTLDAWIDAGLLAEQLNKTKVYRYDELLALVQGLRRDTIPHNASAMDALRKMHELHIDNLPAIDENRSFKFMLNRNEILSKVVTDVILARRQ